MEKRIDKGQRPRFSSTPRAIGGFEGEIYLFGHPGGGTDFEKGILLDHQPLECPYCGNPEFVKDGRTKTGMQRHWCEFCLRDFTPISNTVFDDRKVPPERWLEFVRRILTRTALRDIAEGGRYAMSTIRYWLKKVFFVLDGIQDDVILSGTVFLDETFIPKRGRDVVRNPGGSKKRGVSVNQRCVMTAMDLAGRAYMHYVCDGKPTKRQCWRCLSNHIAYGSTVVHDEEDGFPALVRGLGLRDFPIRSDVAKKRKDPDNPLTPINRLHSEAKGILSCHPNFRQEDIPGWLDLLAFKRRFPDRDKRFQAFLDLCFRKRGTLRYRDIFGKKSKSQDSHPTGAKK